MEENKIVEKTVSDTFFKTLKAQSPNKQCADCDRHSPVWVSTSFGIFLCSDCASKHRALGVTISKIKSIFLDKWTVGDLRRLSVSGNGMVHELGDTKDIRLKYTAGDEYKKKIDKLVRESETKFPGQSFMNQGSRKEKVVVNEVKAVPVPKFRDSELVEDVKGEEAKEEAKTVKPVQKKTKENTFFIKKKDTPAVTKNGKQFDVGGVSNTRLGFGAKPNK